MKIKEREKRDKFLDLARELRKLWNMRIGTLWNGHQRIVKGARRVGNRRTNRDHPNYNIINIVQNIKKSPVGLKGVAVTQTQVKDH